MHESSEHNRWNQGARRRIHGYMWWGHRLFITTMVLGFGSIFLALHDHQEWSTIKRFVELLLVVAVVATVSMYVRVIALRRNLLTAAEINALTEERDRMGGSSFFSNRD